MRLYEYESKAIFQEYGLSIPRGRIISPGDTVDMGLTLKPPFYLKAQVPVGGRGKTGGIEIAQDLDKAKQQIAQLFKKNIGGYRVEKILIEEAVRTEKELYLSSSVNRQERCYSLLAGTSGGIDIEETAKSSPETIIRLAISPLRPLSDFDICAISAHLGIPMDVLDPIVRALYAINIDLDCEMVEINPLAITSRGLVALDAKIIIDDSSLYRHPSLQELPARGRTREEEEASKIGLNYVSLDGNIGIIGNGAGLTMATMDLLKLKGGSPANFLDVGAGATAETFRKSISFLMGNQRVRVLLVNIFGGLTRGDEVAKGIIDAIGKAPPNKPVVIRLAGTNAPEGIKLLRKIGIPTFADPQDAVESAILQVVDHP